MFSRYKDYIGLICFQPEAVTVSSPIQSFSHTAMSHACQIKANNMCSVQQRALPSTQPPQPDVFVVNLMLTIFLKNEVVK